MASLWARKLGRKEEFLAQTLVNLPFAFPRGRIQHEDGWKVYHGFQDLMKFPVARQWVEAAFGLREVQPKWEFLEHEQAWDQQEDKARQLLGIEESWPAANTDPETM